MPDRRLRTVPDATKPILIDPPCPDTLSDDWITGWQACREILGHEWLAAYERGREERPSQRGVALGWLIFATSGFVMGFALCAALFT